jgi:hypothetical protein
MIALFLLTSAATAYAECAWVLWLYATTPAKYQWIEGTESLAECRRALDRHLQAMGVSKTETWEATGGGTGVTVGRGQIVLRCLPDTIDPRGPKGK